MSASARRVERADPDADRQEKIDRIMGFSLVPTTYREFTADPPDARAAFPDDRHCRQDDAGTLSARVDILSSDEIGHLGVACNRLDESLERLEELRKA